MGCLWSGMTASLNAAAPITPHAAPVEKQQAPLRGVQGLWVWRESSINTPQARQELLNFAREHGFNRLLVQIHRVRETDRMAIRLPSELSDLLARASEMGIAIEALDGANDMAFASNHERTLKQLDILLEFNRSLPEGKRFVGMHYDIEPYTSQRWKESDASRQEVMVELLEFYQKARQKLDADGTGMLLSADIPAWYDRGDRHIVTFNGQTKNLHMHIQDVCDYIGIMSYRRHALGRNSVLELVKDEMDYGRSIGKTVMPALETIELKEDQQISFFGLPVEEFWKQHALVLENLKGDKAFGGVLTHSYDGLKRLIQEPAKPAQPAQ